jgi:hypothetical protein
MSISAFPDAGRARPRGPAPGTGPIDYERLQARSHLPAVQAAIRRLVVRGVVRAVPCPGDPARVRVVPAVD